MKCWTSFAAIACAISLSALTGCGDDPAADPKTDTAAATDAGGETTSDGGGTDASIDTGADTAVDGGTDVAVTDVPVVTDVATDIVAPPAPTCDEYCDAVIKNCTA